MDFMEPVELTRWMISDTPTEGLLTGAGAEIGALGAFPASCPSLLVLSSLRRLSHLPP